jgi:transketolase
MRKEFFDILYKLMEDNPKIFIIFVGLGYPRYDEFKDKYPNRTINSEACEQTALDIAVGLAHEGMIPFVYTITPFFWRGAETIRLYMSHDNYPVVMCGAGRDEEYTVDDGFTHDGKDIKGLMDLLDITSYFPEIDELPKVLNTVIQGNRPYFISLRR